jgi:hypothetical protein
MSTVPRATRRQTAAPSDAGRRELLPGEREDGGVDAAYAARLADLKIAMRMIGDTYEAHLRWICGFVREEPATWHSARVAEHADCLVALTRPGLHNLVFGIHLPDRLTRDEVVALHEATGRVLRDVVAGRMASFLADGMTVAVRRISRAGERPAVYMPTYGHKEARTAVLFALHNLIDRAGGQLHACPACQAPFVAHRKQRYCSLGCNQRIRNKRKEQWPGRRRGIAR